MAKQQKLHIAIDGPVAAGKGSVAILLAKRLGIAYVDTGAMYRTVALLGIRYNVDLQSEARILNLLHKHRITIHSSKEKQSDCFLFLDGEDVTDKIRAPEVSQGSSLVSVHAGVRRYLVGKQQAFARDNDVVMEGRDIAKRVLPDAQVKIFLTADTEERVNRRYKQLVGRGTPQSFDSVRAELIERDTRDRTRRIDPLTVEPDMVVVNSTRLSIEDVVETIINLIPPRFLP